MASTTVSRTAQQPDWRSKLGRAGLSARGLMYVVIGYLAFQAAMSGGSGSQQASSGGVFRYLASQPYGTYTVGLLAVGIAAFALWMFARAGFGDPVTGSEASDRALYALKGVIYSALAFTAFRSLMSGGGSSGGGSGSSGNEQAAGFLLGLPGGVFITAAIGIGIAGYGAYQAKSNGLDADFMEKLSPDRFANQTLVKRTGQLGYAARGLALFMIGGFFVVAALQHNPDQAVGLGGALSTLAQQPYGPWLLGLAAVGLFAFGLYCFAEAKMRRDHGD